MEKLRRGNLPAETSSFIGRTRELAEVNDLLDRFPLVTVTGAAGVGKTRLALTVAAGRPCPDGVWVAELSAERNPAMLPLIVSAVLGLAEQTVRPQEEVLVEYLAGKRLLLVLDTCEHLRDACADLAERILAAAPGVRILAASRQPLGLPQEAVHVLQPLPVPGPDEVPGEEGYERYDAVRLFAERARALIPGFRVTPAVVRLCRELEGLPLGIELAVRRLRVLSVEELTGRLDDRFALLGGGHRPPLRRHRTLRAAVGWSHELCTPQERLLWARLSVFAGEFDARIAAAVCSDARLMVTQSLLDRLVDKSILTDDLGRYRMLRTYREYGMAWLTLLGEADALRQRHCDHYRLTASLADAEWAGQGQLDWAEWARREFPNLRLAVEHSLHDRTGLELVAALWFVWCGLGKIQEGRRYLEEALLRHTEPSAARTKALWACGWVALAQGDLEAVARRSGEALRVAREQDDPAAVGYAVQGASMLALVRGELRHAELLTGEGLELFRRCPRPEVGLPIAMVTRALVLTRTGRLHQAVELLREQRDWCEEQGEMWARALGDYAFSMAKMGLGELDEAERCARSAVAVKWWFGDLWGTALAVEQMAAVTALRGDGEEAARLLGTAQRIWTACGRVRRGKEFTGTRSTERLARAAVGDDRYDDAFAWGVRTTPQHAMDAILARGRR